MMGNDKNEMRGMGGLREEGLCAQNMGTWRCHSLGIARSIWVYPTSSAQPEKQSVACRQNHNEKFHVPIRNGVRKIFVQED